MNGKLVKRRPPDPVTAKFNSIGAEVQIEVVPLSPRRRGREFFGTINISITRRRGHSSFAIQRRPQTELEILDCSPETRHVLLMSRSPEGKSKFLCGFDERDWFVAAIPENTPVSTIETAFEALKPREVLNEQSRKQVRRAKRMTRKTEAYKRQGEWFFIPRPEIEVPETLILRNEPLRRGRGNPHMAAELYRTGGEIIYQGLEGELTLAQYTKLDPHRRQTGRYRRMVRNPDVFVRKSIRHRDHAALYLDVWHEVRMNTESKSRALANVSFLD